MHELRPNGVSSSCTMGTTDETRERSLDGAALCRGMLIINADDWGGWQSATDAALACFRARRITSATAMVYMEDSERAASIAGDTTLDIGLHINFNQPFTGRNSPPALAAAHDRVCGFLRCNKYAQLVYHPGLREAFRTVFQAQLDEFVRLYGHEPSHFDGHQHMHLCANSLLGGFIPNGSSVRRSFSFWPGEKSLLNRAYRRWVDGRLEKRHLAADYFFALSQCLDGPRLGRVLEVAKTATVELMTHPENTPEQELLLSDRFGDELHGLTTGTYAKLKSVKLP